MFKTLAIRFTPTVLGAIAISLAIRTTVGAPTLLADVNGMGWLVGALGTIYTFVAAFTVVEVWGEYNGVSALISKEAKMVTTIWNYVDYLNDKNVDKSMRTTLLIYLKTSIAEMKRAAHGVRAVHPSPELTTIQHVVDGVQFDDKRDAAIFPLLTSAYEDLSSVRSERIEASVTRLPAMIRYFFILLSILLLASFALLGFANIWLYLFAIVSVAFIVVYVYTLIMDLDNPFDGIWDVSYDAFEQAEKYIGGTSHKV